MKRNNRTTLVWATCLLLPLLLYACTKPAKVSDTRDQLAGVYIGPDTILYGPGATSVVMDTLTVSKYDTATSGMLLNGMFQYLTQQADGSILCSYGNDRLPADDYFYSFYPSQRKVVYRQELQYTDSTVVVKRGVFYMQ